MSRCHNQSLKYAQVKVKGFTDLWRETASVQYRTVHLLRVMYVFTEMFLQFTVRHREPNCSYGALVELSRHGGTEIQRFWLSLALLFLISLCCHSRHTKKKMLRSFIFFFSSELLSCPEMSINL